MNVFDFKETSESELYNIYYNFNEIDNSNNVLGIDYFKVVKNDSGLYSLYDCTKILQTNFDMEYIRKTFEYHKQETKQLIKQFSNENEMINYISDKWYLGINKQNINQYKYIDMIFNTSVLVNKIVKEIIYKMEYLNVVSYKYNSITNCLTDLIHKQLSERVDCEKLNDNKYKYVKKNYLAIM